MDPSIVNFLKQQGQPFDYASRAQLAASKGIQGYVGSAQQNTQLLNMLRGGGGVPIPAPRIAEGVRTGFTRGTGTQPTPALTAPQAAREPVQAPVPAQTTGQPQSAQDLINMGFVGYQGWGDTEAVADFRATGGQGKGGQTAGPTAGVTPGVSELSGLFSQPTVDLPELYEELFAKSGITDIEKGLSEKTDAYNEQVAKIRNNPYLSEATMTGRLSKLADKFNADTANIRNDIATKKADIETQLNLQTKQFDINSQQAKQALSQFNSLLSAGALDNATGEDIANVTRGTGISSSMIRSAIQASKRKNVKTQLVSYDDGTEQGFTVVNSTTGEIIKKQRVAASKPKAPVKATESEVKRQAISDMATSLQSAAGSDGYVSGPDWKTARATWIQMGYSGKDFDDAFRQQYTNPNYPEDYGFTF